MGYTGLQSVIEDLLEQEFANRQLLSDLRRDYTDKWLCGKRGQHKIGENNFTIYEGKFYYNTLLGEWYEVEPGNIFDVMPSLVQSADSKICEHLDADYKPTRYQRIYTSWHNANYSGKSSSIISSAKSGETTPEDVLVDTIKKLNDIIENPLNLREIEDAVGGQPDHLEYLIKISCLVVDFAQQRRLTNEHTLYLLRDCAMFHEAQILLDTLEGKPTSHDQVYLGRQAFSSKKRDAGHWYVAQELLLVSLQKNPQDFTQFHTDFVRSMKDYEAYSPEFAELVQNLAIYLNNHIAAATQDNRTINVIDLGFQGSINMLVKYVLDEYCLQESGLDTKVHMYVIAEWFKGVYKSMYSSDTFSALTHIEVMSRNNAIYEYIPWSLRDGKLTVMYGNKGNQYQADIELAVMAMTALILKKLKS
jgi:hypothetical protein